MDQDLIESSLSAGSIFLAVIAIVHATFSEKIEQARKSADILISRTGDEYRSHLRAWRSGLWRSLVATILFTLAFVSFLPTVKNDVIPYVSLYPISWFTDPQYRLHGVIFVLLCFVAGAVALRSIAETVDLIHARYRKRR